MLSKDKLYTTKSIEGGIIYIHYKDLGIIAQYWKFYDKEIKFDYSVKFIFNCSVDRIVCDEDEIIDKVWERLNIKL